MYCTGGRYPHDVCWGVGRTFTFPLVFGSVAAVVEAVAVVVGAILLSFVGLAWLGRYLARSNVHATT